MTNREVTTSESIQALLEELAPAQRQELTGPIRVQTLTRSGTRKTRCHATAAVLVPLEEPELRGVGIALPVQLTAELTDAGKLTLLEIDGATPEARRQARAYAHSLLVSGAVRDHAPVNARRGPPARPTHEVQSDEHGRQVLVRTGFSAGCPRGRGPDLA